MKKECACALDFFDVMEAREELRKAVLRGEGIDAWGWADKLRERLKLLEETCGVDTSFERERLSELLRIPPWKEKEVVEAGKSFLRSERILEKMIECARG